MKTIEDTIKYLSTTQDLNDTDISSLYQKIGDELSKYTIMGMVEKVSEFAHVKENSVNYADARRILTNLVEIRDYEVKK